MAEHEHTSQ